jgi:hypothetical protein
VKNISQFLTKSPRSYNSTHGGFKPPGTGVKSSLNATLKNPRVILEESNIQPALESVSHEVSILMHNENDELK